MKRTLITVMTLIAISLIGNAFANGVRTVDPLILPQWHQTSPWNGRCPGTGANRAHAGSHALALAKVMKYWAYPSHGTGSVSYVDDDYGPINQTFENEINWNGMSNTLVFQTTLRFIFMAGASVYTDYEVDYSTSSLTNVRTSLINFFAYDTEIQYRNREDYTNFYWKSLIRQELDLARPVIYTAITSSGAEVAFIVDGYDEDGLFHINWSDEDYPNSWVDLNELSVWGQVIPIANQFMLTGVRPSLGPDNIDENFETDFSNFNWQFAGHANWTISTEAAFYGSQSAKSGNINDNQYTSMFIQINVTEADTISFYKRVSCEAEPDHLYDHLAFFIDNVEQERWSGDGVWEYHEYPVSPGVHEFRWTYNKDGASDYFSDCAWVDAIDFPEGTTPLNPPLFVEAEVVGGNQVQLNWSPPPGSNPTLEGYKVYRNNVLIVQYSNPELTSHNDFNLPNGEYTYYVRAVYTEGQSNPSNSSTVTVEVPYAPMNLTASLTGVNTAHLEWQAPPLLRNRVLMGYLVYRDNAVIAQVENPDALEYFDPGLAQGVYYYEVSAVYSVGESPRSNMAQLAVGVPEPPANLQASVTGDTVNLTWGQVADPTFLTGFKVFRNTALIASLDDPLQLYYDDGNLANGAYSYYVRAVYGDVESGNSATVNVSVEVPYPPYNVVATVNGDDVQLTWTNPEQVRALTHYYIYRNGVIIAAVFNPTTIYLDQNLANGLYTYQVSAVYSGVESALSDPVNALVEVLYPPRNLTASVNLADVTLNWMIPVTQGGLRSFNGYNVYRDGALIHSITGTANTSWTDYSVPNGVYSYAVTAVYTTGESTPVTIDGVMVEVLYPVAQLSYQLVDDDVILSWTAAPTGPGRDQTRVFLTYNVYKEGILLAQTTELTYTDANLSNGTYHYYVTALYGSGESDPSPTATVIVEVLYPVTGLAVAVMDDDVSLYWTQPVDSGGLGRSLQGYQVYRDGILLASVSIEHYDDQNLANGIYEYQVYAVYESGISAPSNLATAIVEVLYPPRNLVKTVVDRNDVQLAWQEPETSGGLRSFLNYQLFRDGSLILETTALNHIDEDLPDGIYTYAVEAVYDSGVSQPGNEVSAFIEYPYPPQDVFANVLVADVYLNWSVVPGSDVVYHLYRDGAQIAAISDSSFVDVGLANGTYDYYLTTTNASESGASDPSQTVTAEVNVPYPPHNLQAQVIADLVMLNWSAPATAPRVLLYYKVYRDAAEIATTTNTTYDDAGLANASYSYYVTAVYDVAESLPSNVVNVLVEVYYPATGLVHTVDGDDVTLSWTAAAVSGGLRAIQGYKIYRDEVEIGQTASLIYLDADLANGIYNYYVRAVYSTGLSAPSNTVQALIEVLYPPSLLTYQVSDDDIILSWNAAPVSNRGFLGYNVYRDNALLTQVSGTDHTDQNLTNGVYQYYVTAEYDSGESDATNTVIVTLEVLYPATGLSYTVAGDDVSLNWNAAAVSGGLRDLVTYKVFRDGVEIAQTPSLNYLDADLVNGIYQYYIVASYTSGDALPSNTVSALVEVLYAPSDLVYEVISDTVNLSWTPAPNSPRALLGYNVYRGGIVIALTTTASYSDTGLANGIYEYYVTAIYETGESTGTNTVTAIVEVLYPATDLTYSVSDDDVNLFWNAAPNSGGLRDFLGYSIFRDGALLAQTLALTWTDSNLANGTYQYYVVANYSSGDSTPTNTVTVLVEVFYPPTGLTHVVEGDDVTLNWTAAVNTGGLREIQGYIVYREDLEIGQTALTTYQDLNLANGIYHYNVKAVYVTGLSAPSNTVEALVEVLYPPSNLTYQTNDDDIILAWEAAPVSARGFIGYNIYKDNSLLTQVSGTSHTDQNLANGVYQYYVTAEYDTGESIPTNTVTVILEVLYPATNLSYQVIEDEVTLSWSAAATSGGLRGFIGYKVFRDGNQIAQTTALSYLDADLANGIYQYYVVASYDSGDSQPSNTVSALVEVLYAPSNLSYEVVANTVNLAWTAAPTSGRAFIGYNIYRNGAFLIQTPATIYSDTNLPNGTYLYYVTALYGTGESTPTDTVTAIVELLYPATDLSFTVNDDDVSLFWNAAATSGGLRDLLSYDVYRDGSLIAQTQALTYTDSNLANGTYQYYVTATYSSGTSTPTNTVTVLLEVYYPATALTYAVDWDDVTLSWTAAVNSGGLRDIEGYKIYRDEVEIGQTAETTYLDENLANGTYDYYVIAVYSGGLSEPSNTVEAIVEILYPPSELSATVNLDDVSLLWTAAPVSNRNLLYYRLYRDGLIISQTSQTSFVDQNLANGAYSYYVSAVYQTGESAFSNTVIATVEVPYPVTQLTASVVEDSVILSWTLPAIAPPRAFTGYFIYRNSALHQVLDDPALSSWTDSGLANGSYTYYLVAVYDAGLSISSNEVTVEIYVAPNLDPPTGLTATISGVRDVVLSWIAPNANVLNYKVFRNAMEIATVTETTYTDLNLPNGSYTYYVKAQYAEGLSSASASATVNIMIADPPTGLTAQVVEQNSVLLDWTVPAQGEIGFVVYRDGIEIGYVPNPLIHQYTDPGLANGTYNYSVAAVYASVISVPSTGVGISIEIAYPAQDFALQTTGNDVDLSWSAPLDTGGFIAYRLYRNNVFYQQTTALSYSDPDLANGSYSYYLTALYGTGESEPSPTLTAIIGIAYPPSGLSANVNEDSVTLNWTAPSDMGEFVSYQVFRDGTLIASSAAPTYTDAGLANGSYSYYVTAEYSFGSSAPSNTASATIELLYPATNLSYNVIDNDVYLSWTAAASSGGLRSFLGYKVFRDGVQIALTQTASYIDPDLGNGTYQYYVTASYSSGDSSPTTTVSVLIEVLYAPSNLTYQLLEDDLTLSWTAVPPSGATLIAYKVYRNGVLHHQTTNTTYADNNLANGTYSYYVTAQYSSGESLPTNTVQFSLEIPYAPQNLDYTVTDNDVNLTWSPPPTSNRSLMGYQLYRNDIQIAFVTNLSYQDNDLPNGNYNYYLIAQYSAGLSSPSNTVTAPVFVLYVPTGLAANVINGNDVNLSWTAPNQLETNFILHRNGSVIATLPSTQTSYTDSDLNNGAYSYQIAAQYYTGTSALSSPVAVDILVAYSPSNLTAVATDDIIQLQWTVPAYMNGFMYYKIYAFQNAQPYTTLTTGNNWYFLNDLPNGNYSFHVTAFFGTAANPLESPPSNTATASVEVAYPPTNLTGTQDGDTITLNWTAPTDPGGFLNYTVYRNNSPYATVSATTFTDPGLPNGGFYYRVSANYSFGESEQSNQYGAVIHLAYPPQDASVLVDTNDVSIQWSPPLDPLFLVEYHVYRDGVMIGSTIGLFYTDLDLDNGDYAYEVTADYDFESEPASAGTAHVEVIYQPSNLIAEVSGRTITLSWDAVADTGFFQHYKIYRDGTVVDTTLDPGFVYHNMPNGTYSFSVSALYQSGESEQTEPALAVIQLAYPPTNLDAVVVQSNVNLSWTAPIDITGLSEYRIFRNDSQIGVSATTAYTDAYVANGDYEYYVMAVYGSGDTATSNTTYITVLQAYPPQDISSEIAEDIVQVRWNAPVDPVGLSSYRIYRDGELITEMYTTAFTDGPLYNGTYSYRVTAMYGVLESSPTEDLAVTILVPYAMWEVSAAQDSTGVLISWTVPDNAGTPDAYNIYILNDGDQDDPEQWILLAEPVSGESYLDTTLGGLTQGDFVWAVIAKYGALSSAAAFSNMIHVEPEVPPIPETTKLVGNYPNPFNPGTTIHFELHEDSPVRLCIFNQRGQLVRTLVDTNLGAGEYRIPWDGKDDSGRKVNSGIYISKLKATGYTKARTMTLMK